MKADPRAVGRRLRSLRKSLGLSQRDIQAPGTSYAYISRIEAGTRRPSLSALIEIGSRLGVSGLELLTGDPHAHCPLCGRGGKPQASAPSRSTNQIRSGSER